MQRLIANICGLWSSQKGEDTSPCWSSSWGRMHKIQREIEGCRITRTGRDGSARVTSQKRGKGSKKEYKKQLAGTKDDFMALQKITTAIKSALSFLEEAEGKERKKSLDCREECRNSHHSEQPWHSWGSAAGHGGTSKGWSVRNQGYGLVGKTSWARSLGGKRWGLYSAGCPSARSSPLCPEGGGLESQQG